MLPPATHAPLVSILTSLLSLQTSGGGHAPKRYYSFLFRDLPDRRDYADYYILIKEPRCLNGVMDSLKKGIYSSPQAVAYDLFLVWNNAREYNEQGSQVYNDADKLESYMESMWKKKTPPLPPWGNLPRPGTLPPAGGAAPSSSKHSADGSKGAKRIKFKHSSLAAPPPEPSTSSSKASSSKTRISLSLPSAPSPVPSLSSTSKGITLKLGGGRATSAVTPAAVQAPLQLSLPKIVLPVPSSSSHHPSASNSSHPDSRKRQRDEDQGSPPAGSAIEEGGSRKESKKERRAREKAERAAQHPEPLAAAAEPIVHAPGIPDEEPGWFGGQITNPTATYLGIIQKLRDHTDSNGRRIAAPLLTLPDRATRPDYYRVVSNPIALDTIEERVKAEQYASPEDFDRDLHHLFAIARQFIRQNSPGTVYSDLVVLQRLYQELTKRVSPATIPPASLELAALSSVAAGPGNIQSHAPAEHGGTVDAAHKGVSNPRVQMKDKIFLDGINFKGDVLRVGEWVHLLNPDNPGRPIIAQIFKCFKRADSPQRCLSVCWYYRPEETVHPASRQFYENEVFKTSNFVDHAVEDFVDKCFVMFFTRYVRGRPTAPTYTPDMQLYVVEHRYKDDVKSFKKIKNWNSAVPDEIRQHEYHLELNREGAVVQPPRVKSPFVRGVVGPGGIGEAAEHEEEEQAKYHLLPSGEPATPQKLRALKKAEEQTAREHLSASVLYGASGSTAVASGLSVPQSRMLEQAVQPVVPPAPPVVPGLTPAQLAIQVQKFHPLPSSILSRFRSDENGDVLWFTAPAVLPPPPQRPVHSQAYLQWKAAKLSNGALKMNGGDVTMEVV